ncbi:conserved hypothetical protein [Verticillium alfalfae VaMs.102]|uniref:Uncharacterized protein n=1 Tax=Verticillium alfalfae (strain VaMs.102 / ATCC MYA-4576 / FGSC 10136) TaxID=526221 RepID=C9SIG6_VERA1|nr:conserved hypothetical protein [Verticillium alfalfae VaMs.102]EEY18739.1 conserved hypothetical protein [Verticillium alfalfae VaMs.102]
MTTRFYSASLRHQGINGARRFASSQATEWPARQQQQASALSTAPKELPDLRKLPALVLKSKERFLSTDGIPTPQLVLAALRTCQTAANAIHPHLSQTAPRSSTTTSTASSLLSLDSDGGASSTLSGGSSSLQQGSNAPALLREAVNSVSESAYAIVAHPPVSITPEILDLYVHVQARLGRPETLPHVFELYASKPKPEVVAGAIKYVEQNPKRADKAIEATTAETGLGVAIEAKNLDAALGVIECCYTSHAFRRQKLLKKAFLPAAVMGAAPFAAYALASVMSNFQNTVEASTATTLGFAAIMAYLSFTSTIGVVAKITSNDHMKRVTWAPGIPLHERWMREEERAGLDAVACAWGFREKWRHGEEGGVEWESMREYLGLKGMILDRVEFMEGMQ